MDALLAFAAQVGTPRAWLFGVLDATVKGSLVLLVAALLTYVLRRASASSRHMVWSIAIACQLLLPVFSAVLPRWDAAFPPASYLPGTLWNNFNVRTAAQVHENISGEAAAISESRGIVITSPVIDTNPVQAVRGPTSRGASEADDSRQWVHLIAFIWLVGVVTMLLRSVVRTLQVARLAHEAVRVTDPRWLSLAQRVALQLGIRRPITLLRGNRLRVPVTWGVIYPSILLPADADRWNEERRWIVLTHEVAHVRRFDALIQFASCLALALFWLNPLLWVAVRRMRFERECACDDYVLSEGVKPSAYVHHLVDIVRSMGRAEAASGATLAIGDRSDLEGRMLAVLNVGLPRRTAQGAWIASAAILVLTLPLAALSPIQTAVERVPTTGHSPAEIMTAGVIELREEYEVPSAAEAIASRSNQRTEWVARRLTELFASRGVSLYFDISDSRAPFTVNLVPSNNPEVFLPLGRRRSLTAAKHGRGEDALFVLWVKRGEQREYTLHVPTHAERITLVANGREILRTHRIDLSAGPTTVLVD